MKRINSDKVFDVVNLVVMLVMFMVFLWPLWFVLIASISDPTQLHAGHVLLWPKGITLEGYKYAAEYKMIWVGYKNSLINTVIGTSLNLVMSVCMAYPLSDKRFRFRRPLTFFYLFTTYFGGGLIPHYLLYRQLGIINTRWVMFFPGLVSVSNSLIFRSYFQNLPGELKEAATIDGADSFQYLCKVVLPLSKPVFAVVGLYYLVGHWNAFRNYLYYIYDNSLITLQGVLRRLLMTGKLFEDAMNQMSMDPAEVELMIRRVQTMQYGVIIIAAIPVLCIYPFVQKYFVKGALLGSVKG